MTGAEQIDAFPPEAVIEDNDKRYSTLELMSHAHRITGVTYAEWHLDVAADEESHWAPRWFSAVECEGSIGVNGLEQPWFPSFTCLRWNVWANIPFSNIEGWLLKAWKEAATALRFCAAPLICMVLPSDRTDKKYWQDHVEPFRDSRQRYMRSGGGYWVHDQRCSPETLSLEVHHLPGRIRYGHPGNARAVGVGQPMFGSSLLVWRVAA